jgi:RNA polymerase sigma-70 factor (ECF subfamily)
VTEAGTAAAEGDQRAALLSLYDRALPQVYGYLVGRSGNRTLAEDLTADTFFAAAQAVQREAVPELTVGWLITVARNKLVDHWRKVEREQRNLHLVYDAEVVDDEPDFAFERERAHDVLASLGPHHRSVLTLRYLDSLSVPETASCLGRTVHATEALLMRAKHAFRAAYLEATSEDSDAG